MQVIIENSAGPNIVAKITGVAPGGSTTISGFNIGDTIGNGNQKAGGAQSGGGSRGKAYGTIQVQMLANGASSGPVQTLNYHGSPENRFGKCPCTPSPTAQSTGDFEVSISSNRGDHSACSQTFNIVSTSDSE
jgi:hypothetical protein